MTIDYRKHPRTIHAVIGVTELRRHLAHYIAMVRYGSDWVKICRTGTEPVWLVSQADMDLIRNCSNQLMEPPAPRNGKRFRPGFWALLKMRPARSTLVMDCLATGADRHCFTDTTWPTPKSVAKGRRGTGDGDAR